jgi:hypothetical protein
VQWQHTFTTDAWDVQGTGTFVNSDADVRMDYTPSMQALVRAYYNTHCIDRQAVYVFLINLPCTDASLKGFMPFNRQFGFVFTQATGTDAAAIARTIAHCLSRKAGSWDMFVSS